MSFEWQFTECILLFLAFILFIRLGEKLGEIMTAAHNCHIPIEAPLRHLLRCRRNSDFYCFFHTTELTEAPGKTSHA